MRRLVPMCPHPGTPSLHCCPFQPIWASGASERLRTSGLRAGGAQGRTCEVICAWQGSDGHPGSDHGGERMREPGGASCMLALPGRWHVLGHFREAAVQGPRVEQLPAWPESKKVWTKVCPCGTCHQSTHVCTRKYTETWSWNIDTHSDRHVPGDKPRSAVPWSLPGPTPRLSSSALS